MEGQARAYKKSYVGQEFLVGYYVNQYKNKSIKREKIWRQRYNKIRFAYQYPAAFPGNPKFLCFPAEKRGPQHMCQLMAHNVDKNRLVKDYVNDKVNNEPQQEEKFYPRAYRKISQNPDKFHGGRRGKQQEGRS